MPRSGHAGEISRFAVFSAAPALRLRIGVGASRFRPDLGEMDELELLDWKRRVFALYADARTSDDAGSAWRRWRDGRDALFGSHPQSPFAPEGRAAFAGLPYFDYDPAWRALGEVVPGDGALRDVAASGGETVRFRRFGVGAVRARGRPRGSSRSSGSRPTAAASSFRSPTPQREARPTAGALPARHGQGRRPRRSRRSARAGLQLRLQPVVLVRPALGLSAQPAGEPAAGRGSGRRAALIAISHQAHLFRGSFVYRGVSADATAVSAPRVDVLALGAAGITVVLWASAFVGIRAAGHDFSPGSIALGRVMVAAIVLGLLVAVPPGASPRAAATSR